MAGLLGGSHPLTIKGSARVVILHAAVEEHNLTKRWFDLLLEARLKDLDNIQPATIGEVEE